MMACIVINVPAHSYVHCQHMSSVSLPLVTITDSAKLSPTTTTPFLSTSMMITDESFPAATFGIATGVGAGFLLAIFIVIIVIAVFLLVWRRKRKYSLPTDHVLESPMHGHKGKYMQPCMIIIVKLLLHILSLICF